MCNKVIIIRKALFVKIAIFEEQMIVRIILHRLTIPSLNTSPIKYEEVFEANTSPELIFYVSQYFWFILKATRQVYNGPRVVKFIRI